MSSAASVLNSLVNFYELLIVVWCFMSWIPRRDDGLLADVAEVLDRIVSPYVSIFSRLIPPVMGMNFSPVVAVLVLEIIQNVLVRMLY